MVDLQRSRGQRVGMAESQSSSADPSNWEFARALETAGTAPKDIEARLVARGLDVESAKVLVNSLPGASGQPTLPTARLDMATNPLSGAGLSSADIGLQGPRKTVGAYWVAFGLALAVLLGALLLADQQGLTQQPLQYGVIFTLKAGIALGCFSMVLGAYKILTPGD